MNTRVLYITHRVPFPPDRGDRIRSGSILRFLAERATVDLACLADEPVSETTQRELRALTRRVAIIPHQGPWKTVRGLWSLLQGRTVTEGMFASASLRRLLRTWTAAESYDAVLASSSGLAAYIGPSVCQGACARWMDLVDVDSRKWLDYSRTARWPMSWLYRTEGRRLQQVESDLTNICDRLLVVSDAERALFQSFCPTDRITTVCNGVDADYFSPGPADLVEPFSCVFAGVMNYKPNVDGVIWFARNVWPTVRTRFPEAVFHVVGRDPLPEVRALAGVPGIDVTGSVPDVRPWLHRATCAVIPLQIARGIQNKVLEAMACGLPVICSPAPLQGLSVKPGLQLLQADDASRWIEAISVVFQDPELRTDLGLAASAWVRTHHVWNQCLSPLTALTTHPARPEAVDSGVPA